MPAFADHFFPNCLQNLIGTDERRILHIPSVVCLSWLVPSFDLNPQHSHICRLFPVHHKGYLKTGIKLCKLTPQFYIYAYKWAKLTNDSWVTCKLLVCLQSIQITSVNYSNYLKHICSGGRKGPHRNSYVPQQLLHHRPCSPKSFP